MRLSDELLDQAREEAAKRGMTLTALLEQGLRLVLARPADLAQRLPVRLPVSHAGGGTLPGIDLNDSTALLEAMEEPEPHL